MTFFAILLGKAIVDLRTIDSAIERRTRLLPGIPSGIAIAAALGAYLVLLTLVITNVYIPLQFRGLLSGFKYWWPYWH